MDVLNILLIIIAAVVIIFLFGVLLGLVLMFLPAIATVLLGQYLWSHGHDNWAVMVYIVGGILSIAWFLYYKEEGWK